VRAAEADILLVAMDEPAQEKWIDRHVGPGHARLVLSAGGLFETLLEEAADAPHGLEKPRYGRLHRFMSDPARRLRRYGADTVLLYHAFCRKLSSRTAKAGLH
jgi:UDP-N-acetyl-D-mannosaminuronic acid transferase (WecB/TagA/CpsF family)